MTHAAPASDAPAEPPAVTESKAVAVVGTTDARVPKHADVQLDAPTKREPFDFVATMKLADTLFASGFLPKSIKNAAQALALILTGREMGLQPMQSIRSIGIIDGKPIVAADLQLGLFKRAGGRAIFARLDDKGAKVTLRHPNGDEHTEEFSESDARAAGLLGKDNWKRYPKAMYRSRVITAALKSIGFEPMAGVYDPEELEGVVAFGAEASAESATSSEQSSSIISLDALVPFGKHKGVRLGDVKHARDYFKWLVAKAEEENKPGPWIDWSRKALLVLPADDEREVADEIEQMLDDAREQHEAETTGQTSDAPEEPLNEEKRRVMQLLDDERIPLDVRTKWRVGLDELTTLDDWNRARTNLEALAKRAKRR